MKREHKVSIGGRELRLSLSFGTSLKLLDEVGSPSAIVEDILKGYEAERKGETFVPTYKLNERMAAKVLEIGNAEHEGLSFNEIGELVMEHGVIDSYRAVFAYLNEIIIGRATEAPEVPEVADGEK